MNRPRCRSQLVQCPFDGPVLHDPSFRRPSDRVDNPFGFAGCSLDSAGVIAFKQPLVVLTVGRLDNDTTE